MSVRMVRSTRLGFQSRRSALLWPTWAGKMNAPSTRLNNNVSMMTVAMSPKKSPKRPSMKKNDANATMVVTMALNTAGKTSKVPSMVAVYRSLPISKWR